MAEIDTLAESLNKPQIQQLRWHNVENNQQWISGEKPVKISGRYRINLVTNGESVFILPAGAQLRLTNQNIRFKQTNNNQTNVRNRTLSAAFNVANSIKIEQSLDSYLFVQKQWQITDDLKSWLANNNVHQSSMVRLSWTKNAREQYRKAKVESFEFELYFSQYSTPLNLASYREWLKLETKEVSVKALPSDGTQKFNFVRSGQVNQLEITGPVDLELQLRKEIKANTPHRGDINLDISINQAKSKRMILEYVPEVKKQVEIGGDARVMSNLTKGYLSLPEGKHQLSLLSYSDVYLRLLKQSNNDYLFFGLNQPQWNNTSQHDFTSETDWRAKSKQQLQTDGAGFAGKYQNLQHLARNNTVYNSGLAALAQLNNQLIQQPNNRALASLYKKNQSLHGHFSNLLPTSPVGYSMQHKMRRFMIPALSYSSAEDRVNSLPNDLLNTDINSQKYFLNSIAKTSFVQLPSNELMTYLLPKRNNTSEIRLLVLIDQLQQANIKVVFDDGVVVPISTRNTQVKQKYFYSNITQQLLDSDCCLRQLNRFDNTPIEKSASITIPIGENVQSFSIISNATNPTWVAAQVYISDNYQLGEEEYRQFVRKGQAKFNDFRQLIWQQIGSDLLGFSHLEGHQIADNLSHIDKNTNRAKNSKQLQPKQRLPQDDKIEESKTEDIGFKDARTKVVSVNNARFQGNKSDLDNQWLPLARQFTSIYSQFVDGLDLNNSIPKVTKKLNSKSLDKLKTEAILFEKSQQWVLAIENWSQISQHSVGDRQINALFKLAEALNRQGSYRMAEKLLRSLALQTKVAVVSDRAFEILLNSYLDSEQKAQARNLIIACLVQFNRPSCFSLGIQSLADKGQWLNALQLAQLVPEETWPLESVLLAAASQAWWETFERALLQLPLERQLLWQGHRLFIQGDYGAARKIYVEANTQVRNALPRDKRHNQEAKAESKTDIETWLDFSEQLVKLLQQADLGLFKIDRDFMLRWLNVSALNPSNKIWRTSLTSVQKHAGGLKVFNPQRQLSFNAVYSTKGSPVEMQMIGPAKIRLAIRPVFKNDLGIGNHIVEQKNGLFQVEVDGVNYAFPIINNQRSKTLTIENSQEQPGTQIIAEFELAAGNHDIKLFSDKKLIMVPEIEKSTIVMPSLLGLDNNQMLALLKQDQTRGSLVAVDGDVLTHRSVESESFHKMTAYLSMLATESNVSSISSGKMLATSEKHNLAQLKPSEILALAKHLMYNNLLDHKLALSMQKILNKIGQNAVWVPVTNILQSAGIRQMEQDGRQVDSPTWRSYLALFNQLPNNGHILSAGQTKILSVYNPVKTKLKLQVKSITPWFLSKQPVLLDYWIDDNKKQRIIIKDLKSLSINLPAGNHQVSFEMIRRDYDQFLWFDFIQQAGEIMPKKARKNYHLSTHDEPFEAIVDGPAWVRIDRFINNRTSSHYQFIADKQYLLTVKPQVNQSESLLRVFEWQLVKPLGNEHLLPWQAPNNVLNSAGKISTNKSIQKLNITDYYSLGGQEDGTLSYQAGYYDRQSVEGEAVSERDQFLSAGIYHRYFEPFNNVWYKYGGLIRVRDNTSNSLVINGSAYGQFNWAPLNWEVEGYAYTQKLKNSTAISSKINFSIDQLRPLGLKSNHRPQIGVFMRAHKLDNIESEFIDSDIYTDYKENHLYGAEFSDRYSYKPYIDAEFYAVGSLLTNENLAEVDLWNANFGWRQLMGNLLLDTQLKNSYFQKDKHRNTDSLQTRFKVNLSWQFWRSNRHRLDLNLNYLYDFDQSDNNLNLQFIYHMSDGRDYRDFAPDEIAFRNLRKSMQPTDVNNEIY